MTVRYSPGESENRPWGNWKVLDTGTNHTVKTLSILPGEKLSLQYHQHRDEHWIVTAGKGTAILDDTSFEVAVNDHIRISAGQVHRIINTGGENLMMIEIQLGKILDEADIIRLDDCYGRPMQKRA